MQHTNVHKKLFFMMICSWIEIYIFVYWSDTLLRETILLLLLRQKQNRKHSTILEYTVKIQNILRYLWVFVFFSTFAIFFFINLSSVEAIYMGFL